LTDGKLMWQPLDVDFDRVIVGCVDGGGKNRKRTGDWRIGRVRQASGSGVARRCSPVSRPESLKSTLAYCFGDYGTPPGETSLVLHALLLNHFLRQGGFYSYCGPSEISFCFRASLEFPNPNRLPAPLRPRRNVCVHRTASASGKVRSTDPAFDRHPRRNLCCFLRLTAQRLRLWICRGRSGYPPLLFASFPSLKDPSWPRGAEMTADCAIVTFANWDWFSQYQEAAAVTGAEIITSEERYRRRCGAVKCQVPAVADLEVELFQLNYQIPRVGTPLTNQHYINSPRGEIYGLDQQPQSLSSGFVRSTAAGDGRADFLLTGQDVAICGFVGGNDGRPVVRFCRLKSQSDCRSGQTHSSRR
uniref:Sema domain-containing protein n=1 Tax=Macrostomum lignano TaxID=282301 RepID=A0A1I8FN95_9PLAT